MSAAFTPGPWEVYACPIESGQQAKDELAFQIDNTAPIGPTLYLINAGGKCPATTGCGPTSEANARLIAAAPSLYTAASALIADVRRRYPGEELRCEYMRALEDAVCAASGMEAAKPSRRETGSTEGDSPTAESGDAQTPPPSHKG